MSRSPFSLADAAAWKTHTFDQWYATETKSVINPIAISSMKVWCGWSELKWPLQSGGSHVLWVLIIVFHQAEGCVVCCFHGPCLYQSILRIGDTCTYCRVVVMSTCNTQNNMKSFKKPTRGHSSFSIDTKSLGCPQEPRYTLLHNHYSKTWLKRPLWIATTCYQGPLFRARTVNFIQKAHCEIRPPVYKDHVYLHQGWSFWRGFTSPRNS